MHASLAWRQFLQGRQPLPRHLTFLLWQASQARLVADFGEDADDEADMARQSWRGRRVFEMPRRLRHIGEGLLCQRRMRFWRERYARSCAWVKSDALDICRPGVSSRIINPRCCEDEWSGSGHCTTMQRGTASLSQTKAQRHAASGKTGADPVNIAHALHSTILSEGVAFHRQD